MQKYFCDRCAKEIPKETVEKEEYYGLIFRFPETRTVQSFMGPTKASLNKNKLTCSDCFVAILKLFHKKESVQQKQEAIA